MVRQLHDGMMARVMHNGTVSEAFSMTNGVKQGCVLPPTLFNLMVSAMLMDAYCGERPGIRITHRTDGQLNSRRRIHFQSRVFTTTVYKLLFGDDCALNPTSEGEMQRCMDLFAIACNNFGLIINKEKTMVMYQPPPDAAYVAPQINVNGAQLQVVDNFTYLDSTLARKTQIDAEVARRIFKASRAFGRLQSTVTDSISTPNRRCTSTRTASTVVSLSTSPSPSTSTNVDRPPEPPFPSSRSSSSSSSAAASTPATVTFAMFIKTTHNPETPTNTNTTVVNTTNEDPVYTCPQCDLTFISHIELVGHLRIYRTATGEPVPGAPTYTRRIRLHCPRCTRTFIRRMGL
nr:unnamed protein product [Spirometra erinaceieuropaei]